MPPLRMRLTIINQFYVPDISPTAHLAASLAEHRAAMGDEVTVVTSRGGYVESSEEAQSARHANPRVDRIWTPRLGKSSILKRCIDYGTFYVLALWRVMTLPAQDVIISLTTPPFIAWAAVLHKLLHRRAKIVLWNMDCYPEMAERSDKLKAGGFVARAMRAMNRALFRRLDHLVVLDTAMGELLMSQYAPGDRPLPMTVIPNWEKAEFFPLDLCPAAWTAAEALGLTGRFVVLYLGNMGYAHTFDTVVDAAELMRDEPITFLFIGGGSRYDWVRQAKEQRALRNVVLHDYVPKELTPSVMAAAHCALITLRDEILGVVSPSKLHSNLAMGLPVAYVGPQKSNVDDALRQFDCGISLRNGQARELAAFVRALADDPARLMDYRARARAAFDQAYCDICTLRQFDRVIDSATGRAGEATSSDSRHNEAPPPKSAPPRRSQSLASSSRGPSSAP